jgi:DNA-binding Lrp family transcriptional regulator
MKKSKPAVAKLPTSSVGTPALTEPTGIRYVGHDPAISAVPCTIHAPVDGGRIMSDRAYILINVLPGRTSDVVLDIIVVVEVSDQEALTQLVLSRIHEIDGVSQTDTHLVYRMKTSKAK